MTLTGKLCFYEPWLPSVNLSHCYLTPIITLILDICSGNASSLMMHYVQKHFLLTLTFAASCIVGSYCLAPYQAFVVFHLARLPSQQEELSSPSTLFIFSSYPVSEVLSPFHSSWYHHIFVSSIIYDYVEPLRDTKLLFVCSEYFLSHRSIR